MAKCLDRLMMMMMMIIIIIIIPSALNSTAVRVRWELYKIHLKFQQKHFIFMQAILLYSDHRHVSTTYVAIFRVVNTITRRS